MRTATLLEEHASVLPHWVERRVRAATLVCLDARLDLQCIAPERIALLRSCRSAADLARLQRVHPLSPWRDSGFGSDDFLHAAAQLGIVRRLVWVAPPHVVLSLADVLRTLAQREGVTPAQLHSFRRTDGGWMEGEVLGLPVTVVEWQQLPRLAIGAPVLIDLDASYFLRMPQDRIWARPRVIVTALRESFGDVRDITMARSVGTGVVSLRHRFLADHVAALWEDRREDERHWQRLLDAQMTPGREDERAAALRALLAVRPGCAATCHALAALTADGAERAVLLARSAALDGHYAGDVLRHLGAVLSRQQDLDLGTVLRLHRELARWDDGTERAGPAWVAMGLLYAAFGRTDEAIACDLHSLRHGPGHPDLALQIGRLQMAAGAHDAAEPWLQRAAADEETRAAAWLHLSVCASRRGALEQAWTWAHAAHDAAPAWPETGQWLHSLAGKPGYDWDSAARSSTG